MDRLTDLLREVALGGGRFERVVLTRNRRIMASSVEGGRTLRLHEGFVGAPPEVLRAVGQILSRGSGKDVGRSRAIVRDFLAGMKSSDPTPRRRGRRRLAPPPSDIPHLERLQREFDRVNEEHFEGGLPRVPIRLSGRMRRRNGHFSIDPVEVAIARSLCSSAASGEAEHTLRHEMIHLWQWHTGAKLGHRADFRRWARLLDVHPRATRSVRWGH